MLERMQMVLQGFLDERRIKLGEVGELQAKLANAADEAERRDLTISIVRAQAKLETWEQASRLLDVGIGH
jgi:hypothetical protein